MQVVRNLLFTVVVAAVIAASGCGGSKSSTASKSSAATPAASQTMASTVRTPVAHGKPLTLAALIAKADAICARVRTVQAAGHIKTSLDLITAAQAVSSAEYAAFAQLSKLVPPSPMTNSWYRVLSSTHTIAEDTAKIGASGGNVQVERPLLTASNSAGQELAEIGKRYGFKECGRF